MRNKKGFTLVELLAVIVILAVVMLIGGTVVLPMMQKAQKSTVGTEGASLKKAAENAFNAELMKGASSKIHTNSVVCFDMAYLCKYGYYDKGCLKTGSTTESTDGYYGYVLVNGKDSPVSYKMWIANGTYSYSNKDAKSITNPDNVDATYAKPTNCTGVTVTVNCKGNSSCA